jgi:hypothetical protein
MRLVCPVASPAEVTISDITIDIDGTAGPKAPQLHSGPFPAKFNKDLLPGQSYTLTDDVKETIFAGSNIYWDNDAQILTFADRGITDKQDYQGVFFKWGSLIGVSGAKYGSSGAYNLFSTTTPIFVPDVVSHTSWSIGPITSYTLGGAGAADTWEEIPFVDVNIPFVNSVNYLVGISNETSYSAYKGDICRYLSEKHYAPPSENWRMPTADELWMAGDLHQGWSNSGWTQVGTSWVTIVSSMTTLADTYGTRTITSGGMYQGQFFPASGWRSSSYSDGRLANTVGQEGTYKTGTGGYSGGSARNRTVYMLYNDISPLGDIAHGASPIRCVKDN